MNTTKTTTHRTGTRITRNIPRRRYLELNEAAALLGVSERVMRDHIALSGSR